MSDEGERRISYCPYCGAKIDPSFRYCPYCGSPLPTVERTPEVKSRGVEGAYAGICRQSTSTYVGKPLPSRPFSIAALILWLIAAISIFVALPADARLLRDSDNVINNAVSLLEQTNSVLGSIFVRISSIDEVIEALRMIQAGNYLYISVEALSAVIAIIVLYHLAVGRPSGFKASVISFYVLQLAGGAVAGLISSYGLEALRRYLSVLPQPAYSILTKHINRLSLIQRTIESAQPSTAILVVTLHLVLIVVSYLAYREMKK